ncbi:uncharacterized protein K444DRAFT_617175 [Hyaloscypha bicolor E]|jgi:Protein of unknown function (DUF3533)|uniref:DUF3533 domain-containing protein n=1 Tax=Hyaloscypha bicolor E TaxID=1095630 RepID=A0A2J6SXG2_9HELO|nr:uncharacterized protein K444DRAFT_617175 [Hyaloscypha bicolor E]PMD55459.1 hypothetical protein K444DRAFT_617175 [Hyaloscypha bicolor E]
MAFMQGYPKAHQNRIHGSDKSIRKTRVNLLKAAGLNFILLQILFLGLFCYIFGAIWQQSSHIHNMNVLFVDYDGSVLGTAVRDAYKTLQGKTFPTLQEMPSERFPTLGDVKEAVCRTNYWGAIYTSMGASERLANALPGGVAADTYNRSDVLTFVWNEARYSTIVDPDIQGTLITLSSTARVAYSAINGTGALQILNSTDPAAISVFTNPWQLTSVNLQETSQGSRLIYNTLVIILILIQEFFYLGTINGLYAAFKIYAKLYPHRIIAYRNCISLAYTFCGSLCVTGAIWAFRGDWDVNSNQFGLTWAVLWLFAHVNFLWLDVFTIWTPPQYVPMLLITWIVFNVSSILVPFELSPGFYRWSYAMPAHEVFQTLIHIWSKGCNPQLYYALPTLFVLELVGLLLGVVGVYRRCHYAVVVEEAADAAFRDRVAVALATEKRLAVERKQRIAEGGSEDVIEEEKREEEELEDVIREEDKSLQRKHTKVAQDCRYGPAFPLAFNNDPSDSSVNSTSQGV